MQYIWQNKYQPKRFGYIKESNLIYKSYDVPRYFWNLAELFLSVIEFFSGRQDAYSKFWIAKWTLKALKTVTASGLVTSDIKADTEILSFMHNNDQMPLPYTYSTS